MTHNGNGRLIDDLPPTNPEAERGLIACLIALPAAIDDPRVAAVRPGDFFDPACRVIHRHLVGARMAGQSPELLPARITAAGEYSDDVRATIIDLLFKSTATGSGSDVLHFADLVRETARRRKQWELARELTEQVASNLPADDVDGLLELYVDVTREAKQTDEVKRMAEMQKIWTALRSPVIHGLLRRGETMNVIAPPKAGKSWLVTDLALSLTQGIPWFGFCTEPGAVLIVDNELHPETSVFRTKTVAEARGIAIEDYGDKLFIENVRGKLKPITEMVSWFDQFKPGRFQVVILDALYRFLPAGTNENESGSMAPIYNTIDKIAGKLDCCFVLIHHSTKGSQSSKALVDTGAGSNVQSRAADCHLALRAHEEDNCASLDAVPRSFPPITPLVLRWSFPVWNQAVGLDPAALKPDKPPRRRPEKDKDALPAEQPWTAERFATAFLKPEPQHKLAIIDAAVTAGLSDRKAELLLKRAAAKKLAHPWVREEDRRTSLYASVRQPEIVKQDSAETAK